MSESKHTPGPWFVEEPLHRFIRSLAGKSPFVAELNILDKTHGEHMANARLIAAAPDLLAALEALADVYSEALWEAHYAVGGKAKDMPESDVLSTARAALAAARGERAR